MTNWQKAIKYAATAFAIFLTISIISGILGVFGIASHLFGEDNVTDEMKSYEISDTVTALDIEVKAADLSVVTGEQLKLESNLKKINVNEKNGKFIVKDESHSWFGKSGKSSLILYVPENFQFDEAKISAGAGKINIENLNTILKTEIEGGAGEINIKNSSLQNLDFDIGVGEVNFNGAVLGKSVIDAGVGETNFILTGTKEDYEIRIDKGLGSVRVDGNKVSDDSRIGSGENQIEIDMGVGAVNVDFNLEEIK